MDSSTLSQHLEDCSLILKQFFNYMGAIEEKSEKTVKSYFFRLKTFFKYLFTERKVIDKDTDNIPLNLVDADFLNSISTENILNFLYFCKTEKGLSASSRTQHMSAIRKLYTYLITEKIVTCNPTVGIHNPKKKKTLPKYLTFEEAVTLLNSVGSDFYERDYCIITLFLNCGFRLSELVSLNISDIKSDDAVKVIGKGNKERTLYLNNACLSALSEYLSKRIEIEKIVDKDALFVSKRTGKRIGQRRVEQIVSESLKKADLEGFSTHKLRHTAATLMYQNGTDVRTLQQLLGHSSLSTTQIYTHVVAEQVKNAVNNNPLSDINNKKDN